MGKAKIISPQEAAALLRDGDTFTTSGFVASGIPETLNKAVERRFLETGHPRDLTYVYASSQGNRDGRGGEHYAHKGPAQAVHRRPLGHSACSGGHGHAQRAGGL